MVNKALFWILAAIAVIVTLQAASAATETSPFVITQNDGTYSAKTGHQVLANINFTLDNITKVSGSTVTKAYILSLNNATLSQTTFSGNTATFTENNTLTAGTYYYIVVDNAGVGYTLFRNVTGFIGYPQAGTAINWTKGVSQQSGVSIDTSLAAYHYTGFSYTPTGAPTPDPTTYFNITAEYANTGASINTFNATINGTVYGTTNGTIITNINGSLNQLYNITLFADGYYNNSFTDWPTNTSLSGHLANTVITVTNSYTGASINTFNATYNGYTATTTNGTIITTFNDASLSNTTAIVTVESEYYHDNTSNISLWSDNSVSLQKHAYVEFGVYNASSGAYYVDDFTINVYGDEAVTLSNNLSDNLTINDYTTYTVTTDGSDQLIASWDVGGRNLNGTAYYTFRTDGFGSVDRSFSNSLYPYKIQNLSVWIKSGAINSLVTWNATNNNGDTYTIYSRTESSIQTGDYIDLGYTPEYSLLANFSDIYPSGYIGTYGNYTAYLNTSGYNTDNHSFTITNTTNTYNYSFPVYDLNTISFKIYDEELGSLINGPTSTIYLTSSIASYNYTTTTGEKTTEILAPATYTITYSATGYNQREYIFSLANQTYNALNLYLLNESDDIRVTISVTDTSGTIQSDATVLTQRKNLSGTNYYTVAECITGIEGTCSLDLIQYTATYRFRVELDGNAQLFSSTGTTISSDTKILSDSLTLRINTVNGTYEQINTYYAVTGDVSYDQDTSTFTFTWADSNNLDVNACLRVRQIKSGINTILDTTCSVAASGTHTYTINTSNAQEFIALGYFTIDGETYELDSASYVSGTVATGLGSLGLFMFGVLIVITAGLTGLVHPVLPPAIIGLTIAVMRWTGLINWGLPAVSAVIVMVAVIAYLVKR